MIYEKINISAIVYYDPDKDLSSLWEVYKRINNGEIENNEKIFIPNWFYINIILPKFQSFIFIIIFLLHLTKLLAKIVCVLYLHRLSTLLSCKLFVIYWNFNNV